MDDAPTRLNADRDSLGRFVRGCAGGPGRPAGSFWHRLLEDACREAVEPPDDRASLTVRSRRRVHQEPAGNRGEMGEDRRSVLRDERGRYVVGTGGGPGLPPDYRLAERVAAELLFDDLSLREAIRSVLFDLAARAKRGDRRAMKLVTTFVARCQKEDSLFALVLRTWSRDLEEILG